MPTSWFEPPEDPQADDPWAALSDDSSDDLLYRAVPTAPPGGYTDPGIGVDAALDAFVTPEQLAPIDPAELQRQRVTAVLVAHNGARWLPTALEAVFSSVRPPDQIVAVDAGSEDGTSRLLAESLGEDAVLRARRRTGFGAAVTSGVRFADGSRERSADRATTRVGSGKGRQKRRRQEQTDSVEWIWLLHDDCAPDPDALLRLLECAIRHPRAGVLGPKVLGWRERRQLLEVGLTVTGGGRRATGLERREFDQGQHDQTRQVLAVGSAGMLIRRDVWDQLGGFDRFLSVFRDDLDFGWRANLAGHDVLVCPNAVVHHVEAAAHGRRRIHAARGRPHLIDRRHSLYVLFANSSLGKLPLVFLRALIGSVVRAIGFLFGKVPALALEEIAAVVAVMVRPDRLIRGRQFRKKARQVPDSALRRLFPPRGQQLRQGAESIFSVLSGSGQDLPEQRRHAAGSATDTATDPDTDTEVSGSGDSVVRRIGSQPVVILMVGLALTTLLAARSLIGGGRLMGGALLPAPDGAADLWGTYVTSWHGVGLGSPTTSPPYLALAALLGSLVGGDASLAVNLLLLGSVPLAALTSYLSLRRVVHNPWIRAWAAVTYGLLPATTGAIATGRLGTSVAIVLTPLVVTTAARTLGGRNQPGLLRGAWTAGLLLATTAAFVPLAWVAALVLGLAGLVTVYRDWNRALRLLIILGLTPLLFVPWTGQLLAHPMLLFAEPGIPGPGLSDSHLPSWALLFQYPGGPGAAPVWLGVGLLVAGYAVLVRRGRRPLILTGWAIAFTGLLLGLMVARSAITAPTVQTPVAGWPGYAAAMVAGGLILAISAGADGARTRLRVLRVGRGLRVVAATVALAALLTPVVGIGWWVYRGADEPLDRRDPNVVPAYVVDEASRSARVRTLVIGPTGDGPVGYALLRSGGPRLGDAETGPPIESASTLDDLVGDLISGRGGARADGLADFAIRYVYLPAPADPDVAVALDGVPGLVRGSAPSNAAIWRVDAPVARLRIVPPDGGEVVALPSRAVTAEAAVPDGPEGRTLVLAENADAGWEATLDGQALRPSTVGGWAQGFALPANGGQLEIAHQGPERAKWLVFQLIVAALAVVFALPGLRRDPTTLDDVAEIDLDETAESVLPAMVAARAAPVGARRSRRPAEPAPEALPERHPQPSRRVPAGGPRSSADSNDEDTAETSLTWFIPKEAFEDEPAAAVVHPEPDEARSPATEVFDAAAKPARPKGGRRARRPSSTAGQSGDTGDKPTGGSRARGRRAKGRNSDRRGE